MNTDITKKISEYWSERAENYSKKAVKALQEGSWQKWENLIYEQIDKAQRLRILDVGSGPGIFSIILGSNPNYEVIGVDVNSNMLDYAKDNAKHFKVNVNFIKIEDYHLPFEDEYFDIIISRNVTWNFPQPEEAYTEWRRVLKKGGKILNFDANWHHRFFNEDLQKRHTEIRKVFEDKRHSHVPKEMIQKMEEIAKEHLPLSRVFRPVWDLSFLMAIGFNNFTINTNINELVYDEYSQNSFSHLPMFMIVATK